MTLIDQYPNIRKAFLEMSYDNGGIFSGRTEQDAMYDSQPLLAEWRADQLPAIDAWIAELSDDEVNTFVAGEESDREALTASAPVGANDLFNALFEVC